MARTKVTVTDDMRKKAIEHSDVSYTDTDMNRNADTREVDALVGEVGERIAAEYLTSNGFSVGPSTGYEHDLQVNGGMVEVKGRKTWDFRKPDLLVRTKFDLACDVYIQVDLHLSSGSSLKADLSNLDYGEIVGFATPDLIEEVGEPFNQGYSSKDNPTQIVGRSELFSPRNLSSHL